MVRNKNTESTGLLQKCRRQNGKSVIWDTVRAKIYMMPPAKHPFPKTLKPIAIMSTSKKQAKDYEMPATYKQTKKERNVSSNGEVGTEGENWKY